MQFGYLKKYKALHAELLGDTVPCSEWHYKQGQGIKHCFQSFLKCLVKMTLVIVVLAVYSYCPLHLRVSLTSKFNPLFTRCFFIYILYTQTHIYFKNNRENMNVALITIVPSTLVSSQILIFTGSAGSLCLNLYVVIFCDVVIYCTRYRTDKWKIQFSTF